MIKTLGETSFSFPAKSALCVSILALAWGCFAGTEKKVDFSREILPVLSENCFYCHGPDSNHRKAKLRLDDEMDAKKNSDGQFVIAPGNAKKSLLMERITTKDEDDLMPPADSNKKLSAAQIDLLKRWINEGAAWGEHWSFTPIQKPTVPKFSRSSSGNPIDAFVLKRLARENLAPSPPAEKTTLIRRVTLDLTGLPPTPEEVKSFLNDRSPKAYEKVVDRLLSSPAYGERMAWDWMELARYADSNGYQGDAERTMWPWRDWVVRAFNRNMPYDRFTIAQLAGDLLPDSKHEDKLATGFLRNHPINGEGGRIPEENRIDYVMDMTETTGTAWLGLTFNCTRCHDHKFDPITRRDYYSLFAFFNQTPVDGSKGDPQTEPVLDILDAAQTAKWAGLKSRFTNSAVQLDLLEKEVTSVPELPENIKTVLEKQSINLGKEDFETLAKYFEGKSPEFSQAALEADSARKAQADFSRRIPRVMVMQDLVVPRKTFILDKGVYSKPTEEVSANTPGRLPELAPQEMRNRLGLARWLVSDENPLTARVTVNRFWQMFFGIGLVKTSEDFGTKGEYPVHPELLDWLASELHRSGWDIKHLVRLLVTSDTYRQSSRTSRELFERDPENRLLARGPRFRMPSWMLRDQALAASGLLLAKAGGAPVNSYQPAGVWEEATFGKKQYKQDHGDAVHRRSLYLFWRRIIGPTVFFDAPSRMTCVVKPTRNNTPLHSLTTLNDVTYVEAARALAQRAMMASPDADERAERAFAWVLARKPTPLERRLLLESHESARKQFSRNPADANALVQIGEARRMESLDVIEHAAWTTTCLAILNLDETLTKE